MVTFVATNTFTFVATNTFTFVATNKCWSVWIRDAGTAVSGLSPWVLLMKIFTNEFVERKSAVWIFGIVAAVPISEGQVSTVICHRAPIVFVEGFSREMV